VPSSRSVARVALALAAVALAGAALLVRHAIGWTDELAAVSPLADVAPRVDDPHTPRLARRVVLVIVDGLRVDASHLPYLDELRARGVDAVATVPYPTISRPTYVTIVAGVPPRDSGVRGNHVIAPVVVDTIMDRARAAGLRVATASDFGLVASLFLRGTQRIDGVAYVQDGSRVRPPPPITWPVDEARRVGSIDELGAAIARLVTPEVGTDEAGGRPRSGAGGAELTVVLAIDVDRAGHAAGVGEDYAAAATAVDRAIRDACAPLDFTRDAVIITADHGHVAPGGHGGVEPEVANVPLVLAGAGVVPHARPDHASLLDVSPTVAALLGIPAPGHAEGRALVELLALSPADARRRVAADTARASAVIAVAEAARDEVPVPDPARLAIAALAVALGVALALALHRRGALALPATPGRALAGVVAVIVTAIAIAIITHGHASPSYVPTLARAERQGAIGAAIAIALQVAACRYALRRARDRVAAMSGVATLALVVVLAATGAARAWLGPPHVDVPSPTWIVAVPALDVAGAACAIACAISLVAAVVGSRRAARAT
jgi:hypothetical protein